MARGGYRPGAGRKPKKKAATRAEIKREIKPEIKQPETTELSRALQAAPQRSYST